MQVSLAGTEEWVSFHDADRLSIDKKQKLLRSMKFWGEKELEIAVFFVVLRFLEAEFQGRGLPSARVGQHGWDVTTNF